MAVLEVDGWAAGMATAVPINAQPMAAAANAVFKLCIRASCSFPKVIPQIIRWCFEIVRRSALGLKQFPTPRNRQKSDPPRNGVTSHTFTSK
jgi:hypothetical protein